MKSYQDYLKDLPSRVGQIDIDIVGSKSKYPWKGTFSCKVPSIKDYILADQKRAALNGGIPDDELDDTVAKTTAMLSYLSVVIQDFPNWWKEDLQMGTECMDVNLIVDLHDKVKKFEKNWKEQVWGNEESDEQKEA